jgi:PAS domain S-box-containing protein
MSVAQKQESFERRLAPHPSSVALARRLVRDLAAGTEHEPLLEKAVLIVSEVVTNALLHAGTPIDLAVSIGERGIRVEVGDGSPHLPVRRRYAPTAGTGRGMLMLEELVDDWGVSRRRNGKTVWFEVRPGRTDGGRPGEARAAEAQTPRVRRTLPVRLENMPLLLHAAWQEHAETLLREYLLVRLEAGGGADPIQVHAEATDAMALIDEHIPRLDVAVEPHRLMSDATEPRVSAAAVHVDVPLSSVSHFEVLDRTIEAAIEMSLDGEVLAPPTQPEVQEFRRWLCDQVASQAHGGPVVPWSVEEEHAPSGRPALDWDTAGVAGAASAVVAADEANRILAVSPAALDLLGYDRPEQLVGRRIVAMIPERYRQAHIAGFTMHLLVGRRPLLDQPVVVPALRRDGDEVQVEMTVAVEHLREGHRVFVAELAALD